MKKVIALLKNEIKTREEMVSFNVAHKNIISDHTANEAKEMIIEMKDAIKILTLK